VNVFAELTGKFLSIEESPQTHHCGNHSQNDKVLTQVTCLLGQGKTTLCEAEGTTGLCFPGT